MSNGESLLLVQANGEPIGNPLGADMSIPIDRRRSVQWGGFEFSSIGRISDRWEWRCLELCATLARYDNGTWICRGVAGGPSDSGDSEDCAVRRAIDGLRKQQALATATLALIAERNA
jgi:hypothetical protein